MSRMTLAILTLSAAGLLAGCVEEPTPANTVFAENCAACHGADGRGDGPAATGLGVTVPDLTVLAANNDGEFPWERVMSTIDGYSRGAHQARVMPEFGATEDLGDMVVFEVGDGNGIPVPRQLLAMAQYLESIQRTE